jgi:hypothetical protein
VLNWHEVVNDTLGGPLLTTYCPICRSGLVARRTIDGEAAGVGGSESATTGASKDGVVTPFGGSGSEATGASTGENVSPFGVSGLLYRGNLVLYDRATGSLRSQILATAIRGPRTGETLDVLPSTLTTWGTWCERFPGGEVLLPPPISDTVVGPVRSGPVRLRLRPRGTVP